MTLEVRFLDYVVALVGVVMLVVVVAIMIVGFVVWLVSSIRRRRDL